MSTGIGGGEIDNTHDVFISYAHLDAEHDVANAQLIANWLDGEGYDVWWDSRLRFGEVQAQLKQKVQNARHVIVLWSPQAAASKWVRQECLWALECGNLAPVIIEDHPDHPLEPEWRRFLWLNLTNFEEQKSELRTRLEPPFVVRGPDRLPTAARTFIGRENELAQLKKAWDSTADNADPAQKTNVLVFHAVGGAGKSALLQQFLHPSDGKRFPGAVYEWSAYSQGSGDNRTANADLFIASALKHFGHDLVKQPIIDAVERGRELARLVSKQRTLMILDGIEPLQDIPLVNGGRLRDQGLAEFIKRLAQENKGLLLITSRQELPELVSFRAPQVITSELDRMTLTDGVELLAALGVQGYRSQMKKTVEELYGHALSLNLLGAYLSSAHGGDVNQREQFSLGEVEKADPDFVGDATVPYARRAERIMEGTTRRLGEAETAILHMVGLFDRPAEREALDALFAEPAIPGLTEAFHGLTAAQRKARWNVAVERLRKLKLLSAEDNHQPGSLDAHPIVRAHFGDRLKARAPEAYREAHSRLYDFYRYRGLPKAFHIPAAYTILAFKGSFPEYDLRQQIAEVISGKTTFETSPQFPPSLFSLPLGALAEAAALIDTPNFNKALPNFQPSDLNGMQSCFLAITHGCSARRSHEAYAEVYIPRVQRGRKSFLSRQLCALNADLATLVSFFEVIWGTPANDLPSQCKSSVLAYTSYALRAVGRLPEAVEPLQVSVDTAEAVKDWVNAALSASGLSELQLILGVFDEAEAIVRTSVDYALACKVGEIETYNRTLMAHILHQRGRTNEAFEIFEKAEAEQAKRKPDLPRLCEQNGYRYCDLLLAVGRAHEVRKRAAYALEAYKKIHYENLLDISLDNLSLGRAFSYLRTWHRYPSRSYSPAVRIWHGGCSAKR